MNKVFLAIAILMCVGNLALGVMGENEPFSYLNLALGIVIAALISKNLEIHFHGKADKIDAQVSNGSAK